MLVLSITPPAGSDNFSMIWTFANEAPVGATYTIMSSAEAVVLHTTKFTTARVEAGQV